MRQGGRHKRAAQGTPAPMKFTLSWLKDHLDTTADLPAILDAMTMAGLEVEHVDNPAEKLAAFSVAKIVEAVQHPNADRLRVCQVDTKDGRKEIVCGAPNARPGLVTVYAPLGTFIPGSGITLEPRAVRGVVSNGMLCSAAELEIAEDSDGILELDEGLAVGLPAAQALGLADAVVDFEVTPNRPDWLGVEGIARELAAAGLGTIRTPAVTPVPGGFPCSVSVHIDSPHACPAFSGRLIRGVRNGPSPRWLQDRLRAIGLRPISALVDVTNLLSYDRARPLHVFDAGKLSGGLRVRMAYAGESLAALDGKTHALRPSDCVIADDSGVVSISGIMGGEATGCTEATTDVFLESALWTPLNMFQTGRATGIASDARYRFERGVDPAFMLPGLELATRLILDLCGGEASDVVLAGNVPQGRGPVDYPVSETARLTGMDIAEAEQVRILRALGFDPHPTGPGRFSVAVPSWRRDVEGPADLVEDIARIAGFDRLPMASLPQQAGRKLPTETARQQRMRLARRTLAGLGWQEAVTWSFAQRSICELFGAPQGGGELLLANPIASDLDCMRPSALIHLLLAGQRNADRGFDRLALFEAGPVYAGDRPGDQQTVVAAMARGSVRHWEGRDGDRLFALKGDLMAVLDAIGAPVPGMQVAQGARSWWHPGRSGTVRIGPKTVIAEFGELHPRVLAAMGVEGPVLAFELFLDAIPPARAKSSRARPQLTLSPLQPLTRDFAFLVPADKPAGDLVRAVAGADKALIAGVSVFDRYAGPGVPDGQVSLGLQVTLQPAGTTLTDSQIEAVSQKVVAAAAKQGAVLRG
jgi:phenylalanyl-tRNA synthetase beta chain